MGREIIDSIIREADTASNRIQGVTQGKSVDEARLALASEILAFGQSLVQLEAVNPDVTKLSLEVVDDAEKGSVMLAGYAMRLAREVGNGALTKMQIARTISVVQLAGSIDSTK